MLEGLRAVQNTWIGKSILAIIMVFIVISFAIWGIGDIFRGISVNQVAKVGSIDISTQAYRQAYLTELQNLQQRARRAITNEEAHAIGLDSQVLSRMLSDAALDDQARALGLALSDTQLGKAIVNDPSFKGPSGTFDRGRFNAALRDEGLNEQTFVRERRHVYLRQQLIDALVGDLVVPKAVLEALHRYTAETRSIDYVAVPASAVEPIPAPDEAALKSYFDAHAQGFAAAQYRKLVVLSLSASALAKPGEVSDADARALYDQVKAARYSTPERRTVQQIVFPNEADAAAASARLRSGATFADLLTERKLESKDSDLGTVTREQLYDKAVQDAAFALPQDGTSDPVAGQFGPVLVHVAAIEPAGTKPFDAVAPALRQELATRRAADEIKRLHDRIEDVRSSGKPLADAAQSVGLSARTIDAIDARGLDKGGRPVGDLAGGDALLKAAFGSDIGVDNDTVEGRDGSTTWFEVAGIEPAHPRALGEVKAEVEAAWRKGGTAKRLADKAAEMVKALDGGQTVEQLAAANGNLAVAHANDVKRSGAPSLPDGMGQQVFAGPVGSAGSVAEADGARAVFKVLDSVVPPLDADAPETRTLTDRYRTALSEQILISYLDRFGAKVGMKVNQDAVRSAAGAAF